jgi:hypothetical protein
MGTESFFSVTKMENFMNIIFSQWAEFIEADHFVGSGTLLAFTGAWFGFAPVRSVRQGVYVNFSRRFT